MCRLSRYLLSHVTRAKSEEEYFQYFLSECPLTLHNILSRSTFCHRAMDSMGLCVGYLIGNTVFANAIREKKPRLVKVLIACNMAFATGLLVALCYGIYWHEDFQNSSHYRTYLVVASYTCRMVVVLFVLTACYIYWPLWYVLGHTPLSSRELCCCFARLCPSN